VRLCACSGLAERTPRAPWLDRHNDPAPFRRLFLSGHGVFLGTPPYPTGPSHAQESMRHFTLCSGPGRSRGGAHHSGQYPQAAVRMAAVQNLLVAHLGAASPAPAPSKPDQRPAERSAHAAEPCPRLCIRTSLTTCPPVAHRTISHGAVPAPPGRTRTGAVPPAPVRAARARDSPLRTGRHELAQHRPSPSACSRTRSPWGARRGRGSDGSPDRI